MKQDKRTQQDDQHETDSAAVTRYQDDQPPTEEELTLNITADFLLGELIKSVAQPFKELADVTGQTIMIVIEDSSRYLAVGDALQGEPDQPSLFDASTDGSAVDTEPEAEAA